MKILPDDWARIFAIETPLLELLTRAAVLYFVILMLMRVMPRRTDVKVADVEGEGRISVVRKPTRGD